MSIKKAMEFPVYNQVEPPSLERTFPNNVKTFCNLSWNETDASKFCSDIDPKTNRTAHPRPDCSLHESLLSTVRKYVFFVTDKSVVGNYTEQGSCSIMQ